MSFYYCCLLSPSVLYHLHIHNGTLIHHSPSKELHRLFFLKDTHHDMGAIFATTLNATSIVILPPLSSKDFRLPRFLLIPLSSSRYWFLSQSYINFLEMLYFIGAFTLIVAILWKLTCIFSFHCTRLLLPCIFSFILKVNWLSTYFVRAI